MRQCPHINSRMGRAPGQAGSSQRRPGSSFTASTGTSPDGDLQPSHAAAFRRKLAPFLDHARKAGRGQRRRPGRTAASRDRSGSIRAWAKQAGVAVSARGRIPASVVEQYQAVATKGH